MRIEIDLQFPHRPWFRHLIAYVVVPGALLIGAVAISRADKPEVAKRGELNLDKFSAGEALSASKLNKALKELEDAIQAISDPQCPRGYVDQKSSAITLCRNETSEDEVVRVGTGATVFWIDRYEASVWDSATLRSKQYGAGQEGVEDDYPAEFPDSGQDTLALYARSLTNVTPSRYLTWFQAARACRVSGKRLPTNEEWQQAVARTPDSGVSNGNDGACVTASDSLRATGGAAMGNSATDCISRWGAQDMIGNVSEYTSHWEAGLGAEASPVAPWPQHGNYNDDATWNISSKARVGKEFFSGLPAAVVRGGNRADRLGAGAFAVDLRLSPAFSDGLVGFRCVIPNR